MTYLRSVTLRRPTALVLVVLMLLSGGAAVLQAESSQPGANVPVQAFRLWSAWTAKTPINTFDLNRCTALHSGDADGDGLDDLVCTYNYGGATTRTFVQYSRSNRLTGWTNQHPTLIQQFELNNCRPVLSGDVNNDGRLDLICPYDYGSNTRTFVQLASDSGYTNWVNWTGNGNSQFDLDNCRNIQAGDIDGDGLDDLACAYNYGGATTRTFVQLSAGDSLTTWANQHPSLIAQFELNNCRPVLSGDVNGDGRLDLICPYDYGSNTRTFVQLSTASGYTVWINWTGNGNSQFDLDRCTAIQAGDVNGDGQTDLVCTYNYGGATTRTFVQFSNGTNFALWANQHPTLIQQFELNNCSPLLSGDINADGWLDLICPYDYGINTRTFVQLFTATGYTNWLNWTGNGNAQFDVGRCRPARTGDYDGDGYTDIACPYDYPEASTATFVQLVEQYRLSLPAVLRQEP